MIVCYKKLWHLLLDKDMKKVDLERKAGLSHYAMNKLTRNETVTTDVLAKVCKALDCGIDDILELIPEESADAEDMINE